MNSDDETTLRLVEEKIRVKTISLGLRVTEFFHDFDRLRSGYVTSSQFKRFDYSRFRLFDLIRFVVLIDD